MGGASANRLTGLTGGVDGDVLGGSGGAETHTLSTAELPAHTHGLIIDSSTSDDFGTSGGNTNNVCSGSGSTASTGGGGAHNNVQPTIILNYIIKT